MNEPARPRADTARAADETVARAGAATTPDTGPDPLPPRVGEYLVLRKLGEGGMGAVYLAEDPRLGRKVAIKTLKPAVAASRVDCERFLREARAAAQLHHDNVIPILHVGEDARGPYMVMPFLDGEPLDERLKREPVAPPELTLRVGREVCAGLAAAHAKGLIHRDIKPANIWLEGSPTAPELGAQARRCRLLDFGLARGVNAQDAQLTTTGAIMGTPAYMAPEQARAGAVDHRADLWSLGVTLYRMTTGRLPFGGDGVTAVLIALATEAPPPVRELNPGVPPSLADLIERLLRKDPAARPQSADAVAAELARPGVQPGPGGAWGPAPAPAVRRGLPPGLESTVVPPPQGRAPEKESEPAPVGRFRAAVAELATGFALVPSAALVCAAPWAAVGSAARWALPAQAFALTAALAWAVLLAGRLPAPGGRAAPGHRALGLLAGLAAGALAFWCAGWALLAAEGAAGAVAVGGQHVSRDAAVAGARYLLYFGLTGALCRWWLATDRTRAWRVRLAPVAEAAGWGVAFLIVWPWGSAPPLLGVATLAGAALAVQVIGPQNRSSSVRGDRNA